MRCVEIERTQLADYRDALFDIYDRALDVLVIKGALEPQRATGVVDAIEADPTRFHWSPQQYRDLRPGQMLVMGMTLTPVDGFNLDLDKYHLQAERLRGDLKRLFGADTDFEASLEAILREMSGGRPVKLPLDGQGRAYTPGTIRKLPPGCGIPVHCGNFFLKTPGYRELSTLIDLEDQLSYFYTLRPADIGGELEIYDLEWGDARTPMLDDVLYDSERIAREHAGIKLRPATGDLLLFDGGRYYHRVTEVQGEATRWTLGGFVGLSKNHREVLYWS